MRWNWVAVAHKDVTAAKRSWMVYGLAGLVVAMLPLLPVINVLTSIKPPSLMDVESRLQTMAWVIYMIFPLVALVGSYLAIAGEREAGGLRTMLGHPVTRWEVVVGKWLSRSVIVGLIATMGFLVAFAALYYLLSGFSVVTYAKFVATGLLFASVFVSIGIGISTAVRSRAHAMAGVIGTYVVTLFAWDLLPRGLHVVLRGSISAPEYEVPAWFMFLINLRPQQAYRIVTHDWAVPLSSSDDLSQYTVVGSEPFFLETWFVFLTLLAWIVLPVLVGYWRFRNADLD